MADVVRGPDGVTRCGWGGSTPDYCAYHDDEWGRPVVDDVRLYEKLCLEGFQSGLSWLTILRKRENFRNAFAGFEPARVAAFTSKDVTRLLHDAGIVRHRGKVEAAIANARATIAVQDEVGSLSALIWEFEPKGRRAAPKSYADMTSKTDESKALSKELLRRGFRFVGPTTVYSMMQSCGLVNDHLARCCARAMCEAERRTLTRPLPSRSR
ncbi:MAG TPA: DNA-3-methyladenine glycosylase I [Acidimicrobiia bacterium]|nr:DNA-3-methyladenine glycosylase I [Acidimicrobiia bacterium]